MAIEQNKMGLELYKVLAAKEYGYNLTMYDTAGAGTTTPLKVKWIYIKPVNFMLQLPDPEKQERPEVYFWKQKGEYDEVVEELINRIRTVTQSFGVGLTVNDFERENTPKSFAKLVQRHNEEKELHEGVEMINESMSGSSTRSYYVLENARLVVMHGKRINEEVHGARSRNIKEIFVESNGERFRYPTTYLHGAQTMCRHINEGGEWSDRMGVVIRESGKEIRLLRSLNESLSLGKKATSYISEIKADMKKGRGPRGYKALKEKYSTLPKIALETIEQRSSALSGISGLMESPELSEAYKVLAKRELREDKLNEKLFTDVIQQRAGVDPRSARMVSRALTKGNIGFRQPMQAMDCGPDIKKRVLLYASKMAEAVNNDLLAIALSEIAQCPDVSPQDAKFVMAIHKVANLNRPQQVEPEIQQLMDWIEKFE